VNIKIAGKWMFIPLKMVLIDIDPYPNGWQTGYSQAMFVKRLAEDRDAVQRHGDDHQGNPGTRQLRSIKIFESSMLQGLATFTATSPKLSQPQHRPSQQKQDSMANVAIALHLRHGPSLLVNPAAFLPPKSVSFWWWNPLHKYGSGRFSVFHNLPAAFSARSG
jgi:hypothetical protein